MNANIMGESINNINLIYQGRILLDEATLGYLSIYIYISSDIYITYIYNLYVYSKGVGGRG